MSQSNHPSKINGNVNSALGAVKENIGATFNDKSLEANGLVQREKGNAEVTAAKAEKYTEGTIEKGTGKFKDLVGRAVGNERLQAEGKAEKIKGDAKQEVNK